MDSKLRIFKWRKIGFILFLPMIVIMLIVFLAFGYFIGQSDIENTFVIFVLFFSIFIGISFIFNGLLSKFMYPEIGWIGIVNSELTFSVNNETKTYSKSEIGKMTFIYKGDFEWKSKFRALTRYHRRRSDYAAEERFDKIIINDTPYFVKIKSESDKNLFYQIVDWTEKNNIEYSLI
jgi:predicted membrane protein